MFKKKDVLLLCDLFEYSQLKVSSVYSHITSLAEIETSTNYTFQCERQGEWRGRNVQNVALTECWFNKCSKSITNMFMAVYKIIL